MTENDVNKAGDARAQPPTQSTEQGPAPALTLSAYYMDLKLKPTAFLKSVRAANIKLFQDQDIDTAKGVLAEKDPSFSRTLSLGLGNRPPDAVERWVMDVAKSAVRALDPAIMADESTSGESLFQRIVAAQADALQSKNKASRLRAQNIVKLSLLWLTRTRSLDPLQALYALSEISKRTSRESVRSQCQKILVQAKPGQWRTLSAVARLSAEAVQRADRTAAEAMQARERLQGRISQLERELEAKREEMDDVSRELARLRSEVATGKSALEDEQKLRELDLAQAAGRTRHLLTGRLSLLLSDARLALDFEPPQIEAARQRLDAAKETIEAEVNDSHE